MVGPFPPGALASQAAASTDFDIPARECCFTGCCDRGKAFLLEQLDPLPHDDEDDPHEHDSPHP
ncbi:hypothetical protein ACX80N_16235 [Arthrobacter sp. MDT2-16]|uniref:hypothetical protein n=1 Tax=Arthrobacter ruber TaxID=1258893 RepID=UPI000CF396C7|nr:hypothetical protein [Arthrobacter ruber]